MGAGLLADELSAAVRSGPSPRGAFAASLLRGAAHSVIAEDREASRGIFRQLDVPVTGVDWTALCLIVRLNYDQDDWLGQIESLISAINQLGDGLRAAGDSPTTNLMRSDLLGVLKSEPKGGWPPSVQKTTARLILDSVVRDDRRLYEFVNFSTGGGNTTYGPKVAAERRRDFGRWFAPALAAANECLRQHMAPPYRFAARDVVGWMHLPLVLYSNGDSWPAEETAALLTQQLRAYYSSDAQGTTDQSAENLLPASPSAMLTDIVRVTGEIPDFVKTGYPRSRAVAATRQQLESALKGARSAVDAATRICTVVPQ